ncbi:MAG: cytochrome c biogenesis protein CcdA [Spirochaetota bacterium]
MTTPTLALSFAAGLLSFLSPCIVPLVPSYLSFVGGVAATEARESTVRRGVVVLRTVLFVLGFSIVFVVLGIAFSGSGALFGNTGTVINVIAGAVVILLGLNIIFDFWKVLNVERRIHFAKRPAGHAGALVIGMAFGAGWTPCIGPILASILLLAGTSGNVTAGALYLIAFSLGLGVPFLLAGIFFGRAAEGLRRIRRYIPAIKVASGVLLVVIGILIAVGRLQQLSARLIAWGAQLSAWDAAHPALSNALFAGGTALVGLLPFALVLIGRARRAPPHRGVAGLVVAGVSAAATLTLAVLNIIDVVSIASWISGWFRFTGL